MAEKIDYNKIPKKEDFDKSAGDMTVTELLAWEAALLTYKALAEKQVSKGFKLPGGLAGSMASRPLIRPGQEKKAEALAKTANIDLPRARAAIESISAFEQGGSGDPALVVAEAEKRLQEVKDAKAKLDPTEVAAAERPSIEAQERSEVLKRRMETRDVVPFTDKDGKQTFLTESDWKKVWTNKAVEGSPEYSPEFEEDFRQALKASGDRNALTYDSAQLQPIWDAAGKYAIEQYKATGKWSDPIAAVKKPEFKSWLDTNAPLPEKLQKEVSAITETVSLRALYRNNNIPVTEARIQELVADIISGITSFDVIADQVRTQEAAALYPGLADQLKLGRNVRSILDPYLAQAADMLELDQETIDLADPSVASVLGNQNAQGQYALPSLDQYKLFLQKDSRWQNTVNAKQTFANAAENLLTSFGL